MGGSQSTPSCRELTTFVFPGGGLSPQAIVRRPCRQALIRIARVKAGVR